MPLSVRSRLWAGLAAGALAVATPAVTAATAQAASGPNNPQQVPAGILAPQMRGASAFGTTPASTPEQVSFILKERNVSALEAAVTSGLKNFDSVGQFTAKYGQTSDVVSALTSYLASFGIATSVYPGNVDVSASGTAGEFDKALSVTQKNYHVPAQPGFGGHKIKAQSVYSATGAPELPSNLAQYVLAILGLTNYSPFSTNLVHGNAAIKDTASSSSTGDQAPNYLPRDFAATYGLDPLYRQANGAGDTIAIVTLAAPSDASGSGETDLDVEQSGGLAPGANVIVYQAPNTDPGFIDAFFSAASQNKADTLSTSWGEAEDVITIESATGAETSAYTAAFDEAFLELADQGTSVFDAAGDAGAYDDSDELGTTNLSVDTPADSPYATASGGTTTPFTATLTGPDGSATVTVPKQRAWGWDYLFAPWAAINGLTYDESVLQNIGGGGGGYSVLESEPSYQKLVSGTSDYHGVQYLTPTGFETVAPGVTDPTDWDITSTPPLVSGRGSGRAVPDVSADADPLSGYLLYEPSFAGIGEPTLQGDWGGTSFVAPQFNGSTAVIDSYLGHRVGLWNPNLYAFAAGPNSPVTPLNQPGISNDNLFFTGNSGQQYNPASGLGVPDISKFAKDLASAW
jgi:kumamolisin